MTRAAASGCNIKWSHDLECNASNLQEGICLGGNDSIEQKQYSMVLVAIYRSYLCYWLRKDGRTFSQGFGRFFESVRPTNRRNGSGARHNLLAQEYVVLECLGMAGSSCFPNPCTATCGLIRGPVGQDGSLRTSSTNTFSFSFLVTCDQRVTSVLIPFIEALGRQLTVDQLRLQLPQGVALSTIDLIFLSSIISLRMRRSAFVSSANAMDLPRSI